MFWFFFLKVGRKLKGYVRLGVGQKRTKANKGKVGVTKLQYVLSGWPLAQYAPCLRDICFREIIYGISHLVMPRC